MPNRLEKTLLPTGGGSEDEDEDGGAGGGSGGTGGGGNSGGLPPQGTPCFAAIEARIRELWPHHVVTFVDDAKYFKAVSGANAPGTYWRITGSCSGGYVALNYKWVGGYNYPRGD